MIYETAKQIWVTFDMIGFHNYPAAPEKVSYLQSRHRHKFMFKVTIDVEHNDREIEFHLFQTWLKEQYEEDDLDVNNKSCEMLAEDLVYNIVDKYGVLKGGFHQPTTIHRQISVEVSEDGECGAVVTRKRYTE